MLALLLTSLLATPAHAAYTKADYETCALESAQKFAESLELRVQGTRLTDYGYSDYLDAFFTGYSNTPDYFYQATSKAKSAQVYTFESANPDTQLRYTIPFYFFEVKKSQFGSGTSEKKLHCCYDGGEIQVLDVKSGAKKSFSGYDLPSCSVISEIQENPGIYSEYQFLQPNQCAAYGKAITKWTADTHAESTDTTEYECGDEHHRRTCEHTSENRSRDRVFHTGCQAAFNHPAQSDSYLYNEPEVLKTHPIYQPGDVWTQDGKILKGHDRSRIRR